MSEQLLPADIKINLDLLNVKQRAFVLAFKGDPLKAAKESQPDHPSPSDVAYRMMRHPMVRESIQAIRETLSETMIADSHEVLMFWSETMRDSQAGIKERTRCSELLGKFHGLLNDKLIVDNRKVVLNLTQQLGELLPHEEQQVRKAITQEQDDTIDAEYTNKLTVNIDEI